jgi:hypothetical protein
MLIKQSNSLKYVLRSISIHGLWLDGQVYRLANLLFWGKY